MLLGIRLEQKNQNVPQIPHISCLDHKNSYVGLNASGMQISRRTFIAASGLSVLALTGCSKLRFAKPSATLREVQGVIDAKTAFIVQLQQQAQADPINSKLLLTIAGQNEVHIEALRELEMSAAHPSASPLVDRQQTLTNICMELRDSHAQIAARLSDPEIARVVIQISASENVHATQLAGVNL